MLACCSRTQDIPVQAVNAIDRHAGCSAPAGARRCMKKRRFSSSPSGLPRTSGYTAVEPPLLSWPAGQPPQLSPSSIMEEPSWTHTGQSAAHGAAAGATQQPVRKENTHAGLVRRQSTARYCRLQQEEAEGGQPGKQPRLTGLQEQGQLLRQSAQAHPTPVATAAVGLASSVPIIAAYEGATLCMHAAIFTTCPVKHQHMKSWHVPAYSGHREQSNQRHLHAASMASAHVAEPNALPTTAFTAYSGTLQSLRQWLSSFC
jgi:hypothetical protein